MFLLEVLFDLFTAIPFWLLLAFVFCMVKFHRKKESRKIYKRWCVGLGVVNIFLLQIHFTAIFCSGPMHGVVVDRDTGKPIAGALVNAYWSTPGTAPVRIPVWAALINKLQFNCNVASHVMTTDAEGRFSASVWYGAKVWHGCNMGKFHATSDQHRLVYEGDSDARDVSLFIPARIELERKPEW
jgi:hypothetical protein